MTTLTRPSFRVRPAFSLCALACATLVACGGGGAPKRLPAPPVHLATAQTGVVAAQVVGIGSVTPVTSVAIKSRVDGQIVAVPVREGSDVRVGDLLFRLDPRPFVAARDLAAANVARDEALRTKAEDLLARSGDLIAKGYISANQYNDAGADARAAAAAADADRAALANAKLNLEFTELRSPIAGRVGRAMLQVGNLVKANDTTTLLTVLQVDPIYVDFSLPERYLADLRAGTAGGAVPVQLQLQGSGGTTLARTGSLIFLDNQVDQPTGTVRLRATVKNADRALWPGQFARVTVELPAGGPAVHVPSAAVGQGPDGAYVFVVDEHLIASQRAVKVARVAGERTVIAEGLTAGTRVVVDGQSRVLPGQPVLDADAPAAGAATGQ
jgi:multidrug efflux system membrane fusion protein